MLKILPRKKIYLLTPAPAKIHGLEYAWPKLEILTGRSSPYLRAAWRRGHPVTFLKLPQLKKTADLLKQPCVRAKLRQGSRLLVFKNSPQIEKLAQQNHWQILMAPARFNQLLEDKINFISFAQQHRLPILPTQLKICKEIHFQKPLVIQTRRGHAGESTFFVHSPTELKALQQKIGKWLVKVTPYQQLPTFSLNLCLTSSQTFYTQPFYQITGDPRLNPRGSGGVDFGRAQQLLSPPAIQRILQFARRVGAALRQINYRGICGLDFLVSPRKIWLLELNPRLLANLGFLTQQQHALGETTLLTCHLLEFLKIKIPPLPAISQVTSGRFELKHSPPATLFSVKFSHLHQEGS